MKSDHYVEWGVNWSTPLLLMCLAAVALLMLQQTFKDSLQQWGFAMSREDIEVDEDLPNFFEAVKLSASEELCSENENMKEHFGFEFSDPDTIETLLTAQIPKKALQGTPWYQILSNYEYADRFQYIGKFVPEREKLIDDGYKDIEDIIEEEAKVEGKPKREKWTEEEIEQNERNNRYKFEQSDMVMILLNLSYIPDEVVKQIRFDKPGWSEKFYKHMEEYKDAFNKKDYSNAKNKEERI